MGLSQTEQKILKRVRPSQNMTRIAEELRTILTKSILEQRYKAHAVIGGSTAKGTYINGDHDIDIFVCFDQSYDEPLSGHLETILEKFSPERLHGSRDYFTFTYNNVRIEVVPVLDIDDYRQARNITDMSPLHVRWINDYLNRNPGLADEIRLAKLFCKAAGTYGAESYIRGFSGHVIDILICLYGSFHELLKASQNWYEHQVIDVMGHYRGHLNEAKISPLIVIDPVDPTRNAAAALSHESFEAFKGRAAKYLVAPDESFFIRHPLTIKSIKPHTNPVLGIQTEPPEGKEDVIGARLLKVHNYIKHALDDFGVIDDTWQFRPETISVFTLERSELEPEFVVYGPRLTNKEHVERFRQKHPGCSTTIIDGHKILVARVRRKHTHIRDFIDDLLKSTYITDKIDRIKKVRILLP